MLMIAVGILGLALGSFINALVWRLHEQEGKKLTRELSVLHGRSMCPQCGHKLAAIDLLPVFSWVTLRGKCRYCKARISWQYPIVELLTAALFLLSAWQWPYGLGLSGSVAFGSWLASLVLLIALAVYDLRWMLLPDKMVFPLMGLSAVVTAALAVSEGDSSRLVGSIVAAVTLSGLFWALFQVSSGKWIGGGDVKIAVALGFLAGGFIEAILLLFIASLLGTLWGLPLLAMKGKKAHKVAFGPFLIMATFIVFLWGSSIIAWYYQLLGV